MRLHHYTNAWPAIDAGGVIHANWRGLLVHLSTSDDPAGLSPGLRERRYRITVDVPTAEVHRWKEWACAHLDPGEASVLTAAQLAAIPTRNDPPPARPEEWVVMERNIPRREWLWTWDFHRRALVWHNPNPSRTG